VGSFIQVAALKFPSSSGIPFQKNIVREVFCQRSDNGLILITMQDVLSLFLFDFIINSFSILNRIFNEFVFIKAKGTRMTRIFLFAFVLYLLAPQNEHNKNGEQVGEWGLVKKCYLLASYIIGIRCI
jgi:glucan phosphoethanolaminetransferase (alkaline phosphatase superfamily)